MIHVEEINDLEQLAGRRLLWNALLPQTRGATFFQSLDWLEVYWRHFGAGQRLRRAGGPRRRAAAGHLAPGGAEGTNARRPGADADVSAARLGHVLWPHRAESHGDAAGGPAPRRPHAARLGHARSALGRRGRLRPRSHRADDGVGRPSSLEASLGRCPADRDRRHLAGLLEQPGQEMAAQRRALRPPPGRTGRGCLRALSARGRGPRRRRSSLGPLRRLRGTGPAKLAEQRRRRHDAEQPGGLPSIFAIPMRRPPGPATSM